LLLIEITPGQESMQNVNRDNLLSVQIRGLQTFLSKGHISYYTTVRRPDILRNLIASGYVKLYMLNSTKSNSYKYIFYYCQNVFAGRIWPAGHSLETPGPNQQPFKNHVFEHSQSAFVSFLFLNLMLKCIPFSPNARFVLCDTWKQLYIADALFQCLAPPCIYCSSSSRYSVMHYD